MTRPQIHTLVFSKEESELTMTFENASDEFIDSVIDLYGSPWTMKSHTIKPKPLINWTEFRWSILPLVASAVIGWAIINYIQGVYGG